MLFISTTVSPHCVLWTQKVGKTAKGPVTKSIADVRADTGGSRFSLSLQGPLFSPPARSATLQPMVFWKIKARSRKNKIQKHK